jgi:hypothetical protein
MVGFSNSGRSSDLKRARDEKSWEEGEINRNKCSLQNLDTAKFMKKLFHR